MSDLERVQSAKVYVTLARELIDRASILIGGCETNDHIAAAYNKARELSENKRMQSLLRELENITRGTL